MWAKIITIKRTKDLNYFSLCAFNLFNTQFELNYWNKWLFHDILIYWDAPPVYKTHNWTVKTFRINLKDESLPIIVSRGVATGSSATIFPKKREPDAPLVRRGDVDSIHDVFDCFCDLLCSDCVLLKLCFHCWMRDTLLRGHAHTHTHTHTLLWQEPAWPTLKG